jgi:hypothetical protein
MLLHMAPATTKSHKNDAAPSNAVWQYQYMLLSDQSSFCAAVLQGGALNQGNNKLFQWIGLHLFLMLLVAPKRAKWCRFYYCQLIQAKKPLSSTATYRQRRNARYVFQIYEANCRPHYLAWDFAWAFSFKALLIRTPTGFKYCEYGGLTAGGQLSPQCLKSVF